VISIYVMLNWFQHLRIYEIPKRVRMTLMGSFL